MVNYYIGEIFKPIFLLAASSNQCVIFILFPISIRWVNYISRHQSKVKNMAYKSFGDTSSPLDVDETVNDFDPLKTLSRRAHDRCRNTEERRSWRQRRRHRRPGESVFEMWLAHRLITRDRIRDTPHRKYGHVGFMGPRTRITWCHSSWLSHNNNYYDSIPRLWS